VVLLGQVSESLLATLYAGSDLFVMPNIPVAGDMEGFGVVMVEAGAAGLPVLAADLEGIRDVIAAGENGELLPSGNAGAFLDAIARYRDPSRLAGASARARAYVVAHFSWAGIADTLVGILQSAAAASANQPGQAPQEG
jgi:phosphatidyl-myo-inositol dimannoside synthase